MQTLAFLVLLSVALSAFAQPTFPNYYGEFSLTNTLYDGNNPFPYSFYFKVHYRVNEGPGTLDIAVVAETESATNYVGFGWSRTGDMLQSDVVIGSVDQNGIGNVTDFNMITVRTAPSPQTNCKLTGGSGVCPDTDRVGCQNNINNWSATRNGTYLILQYSRPLQAADTCDITITPNVSQFIVYAFGPTTSGGVWPYKPQFHRVRNNLNTAATVLPPPPVVVTTADPTTAVPTTANPTTGEVAGTTGQATTAEATTANPTTAVPTTAAPTTGTPITIPTCTGYSQENTFTLTDGFTIVSDLYKIHYTVDSTNIRLCVVAETGPVGWAAFGISEDGFMAQVDGSTKSDAVIAWISANGTETHVDDFVIRGRLPPLTAQCSGNGTGVCRDVDRGCGNSVSNTSISRVGNYLKFEFTRPLAAADAACDLAITPNVQQYVIFALGPTTSDQYDYPNNIQFHTSHSQALTRYTFVRATSTTGTPSCSPGTEGCSCRLGSSCDSGLTCLSNVCVEVSSAALIIPTLFLMVLLGVFM